MESNCIQWSDLDEMGSLPPDDPRLDHAKHCPACRSLLASYGKFMAPDESSSEKIVMDARHRLSAFIEKEIGGGRGSASEAPRGRTPQKGRLRSRFIARTIVPALAGAALVLLALQLAKFRSRTANPPISGVLRESSESAGFKTAVRALERGCIEVAWNSYPEADSYRVTVYGADLEELTQLDTGGETSFVLDTDNLPHLADEGTLLWRVQAMRMGDSIAGSDTEVLRERSR